MITFKALALAVFTLINSQAQYWRESCPPKPGVTVSCETKPARAKRLKLTAEAITRAVIRKPYGFEPVTLAAALITIGNEETHWARYVWEGCLTFPHPEAAKCDPFKGHAQSLTFWQLKVRSCTIVHTNTGLLDKPRVMWRPDWSVRQAFNGARCANKLIVSAYTRCGRTWAGAFSGYKGLDCNWPEGKVRAKRMTWTESRIRQLII